jgi:hypothetical protein
MVMEIRLKISQLIIVVIGLLAAGILIGLMAVDNVPLSSGLIYLGLILLPVFTIIFKKRYKRTAWW